MEKVRLGECATFINGYAFKPTEWSKNGIPIIRIQNLTGSMNQLNYYNGKLDSKYLINNGDILISWSASLGIFEWKKGMAYLNQHIFKVEFNKKNINKKYFIYLIKSKINEMKKNTHGSTMKHITKSDFDKIEIFLPNIQEQEEISNKLDRVQAIIDLRKKQIEELEELIKSQFVKMFDNEKNEEILNNVCKFINGDRGKNYPSAGEFVESGIPFINAGLIREKKVNWEEMNYITEEKYNKLGSGKIQKDDVLYCLRGSLGKHCIIDVERKGAIASSLVILRANKEKILPEYLLNILDTDEIIMQQEQANNGSSQPNLSAGSVKNYKIKLPNIKRQEEFVNIVKQIDKQKFMIEKSLKEIEELQESLMDKYFG